MFQNCKVGTPYPVDWIIFKSSSMKLLKKWFLFKGFSTYFSISEVSNSSYISLTWYQLLQKDISRLGAERSKGIQKHAKQFLKEADGVWAQ